MSLDECVRAELHGVPVRLQPPPGLADSVLRAVRRRRRVRHAGIGVAVIAVFTIALFGWPRVQPSNYDTLATHSLVQMYSTDEGAFLLDQGADRYKRLPFSEAALSPDMVTVAVSGSDGRLGIVSRDKLLKEGSKAVSWTTTVGGRPVWSPDGTAVLVTEVVKSGGPVSFVARRWDVATGAQTQTDLPANIIGQAEWAADSRRYLVLLKGRESDSGVEPGALRYVEPDGSLGETIDVEGGLVMGYPPGGAHLLLDCTILMSPRPIPSKVVDLTTGKVLREITGRPLGWADAAHYVVLKPQSIEVVEVATGATVETIPLVGPMAALTRATTATIYTSK